MKKDCVFCERKNFEERLIAEDEEFCLIASLGQITDGGYTLLIPKRHVRCVASMKVREVKRVMDWAQCLAPVIKKEYGQLPTLFEHGIVGQTIQHAHLHILPQPVSLTSRVADLDFPENKTDILNSLDDARKQYRKNRRPYLFWHNPYGYPHVCWDPPAPPQYLRAVVAEQLGRPERVNWRDMDPELDKKLWSETVARLKKHFVHI